MKVAAERHDHPVEATPLSLRAVIVDLDGVVTQTSVVHRKAWKQTFDAFLRRHHPDQDAFDDERDYRRYVDGKPRYEGVRCFLNSRGIEAPEGEERDELEDATVHGIGNSKNELFRRMIYEDGAPVHQDAVERIRSWKRDGIAVAIVSSSRNCATVLDAAGLTNLFDARVDGVTLEERALAGKPAPDMYLKAAERLDVHPSRAVVLEDALAGVEAAKRGGFGLVVGVDREHQLEPELRKRGADMVVDTLQGFNPRIISRMNSLPRIFDRLDEFTKRLDGRSPALFLDYDGTLTPIVQRPEMAVISKEMQDAVRDLAGLCMVAVVSGRDRPDVEERVGLSEIVYAGSHGFDIKGPPEMSVDSRFGEEFIPTLNDVENRLNALTEGIEGAQIERKVFSIAVHYRNVAESDAPAVEDAVDTVINDHEGLRKGHGKKVFEVQPDIDWHKGRAVLWLIDALKLDSSRTMPIYIGDDVTDEDAFKALEGTGLGIVVEVDGRASAAEYQLADVDEVRQFLEWLANHLREHAPT